MPYMYQCIREAMRLHATVPRFGRELQNEVVVDGVTLKPGTMVGVVGFCIHHNKHVWGDDHEVRFGEGLNDIIVLPNPL